MIRSAFRGTPVPSNTRFGLSFALIFVLVAAFFAWKGAMERATFFAIGAALFVLVALLLPDWLRVPNRLWHQLGLLLGRIVSPLVLGIIFFGLITPVALGMRLFRRDALRLRRKPCESYWIVRDPTGPSPDSYRLQF